jgi:hypothetical protein
VVVDVAVVLLAEIVTVCVTVEDDEDLTAVVELEVLVVEDVTIAVLLVVEALRDVELDVVVEVLEVLTVLTAVTVMLANPWLGAWAASPMYCPPIAKTPAEVGVRTIEQTPFLSRLQLESMLGPRDEGPSKRTNAVGVEDWFTGSLTVTVHVVVEPIETSDGEHAIAVKLGSSTTTETLSELEAWEASPAYEAVKT